ncbi:unnamed protein product [Cercopithifilaria johnstoni]|uniref:DUF8077 domain-containing protein n=1 Tax=Cercopithifilaria johnstoni TaxID=2874296 RepID=A0A8J2M260_9BILA|nr:unnamed protein product [Cercopithifilaria johnstoni]
MMTMWQLIQIFFAALICEMTDGQMNSVPESGDPTNQEVALLEWSSGIRVFYCIDAPLEILVEPFKQALIQSLNKFCRNPAACRLLKSISFKPDYIVLLDGYPKINYGAVQFRFVIVLPPNAVPMDRLRKPLLTREILSNFLNASIKEFERKFGWKVSSYERFPKFDPITEFMNTALIPIGFILFILILLLAYWSSTISRSYVSSDERLVIRTSSDKRTAIKRTLQIIEQQKKLYAERNGYKESCCTEFSKLSIQTIPKISVTEKYESDQNVDASKNEITEEWLKKSSIEPTSSSSYLQPMRSGSASTLSSIAVFKNVGGRRVSHRRQSSMDDNNKRFRKKRSTSKARRLTQCQWKLTSLALSGFGKSRRY